MSNIKIYEDIERERDRVQSCINKYGWTSDHNLDWFIDAIIDESYKPMFVEFEDGTGLLAHRSESEWRIWSDPLSEKNKAAGKILEFCRFIFTKEGIKKVWCDDVSDKIYPELLKESFLYLNKIYYSLYWPVLNMDKYDPTLPGGHFKETRNAKNKFYREHKVEVVRASNLTQKNLLRIINDWTNEVTKKQKEEDVYDLRYRLAVKNNFRGFTTTRVIVVDGRPVGFNAGYEVPNHKKRFAGAIGLHDYSVKDLGTILYLEDLDWVKSAGYKEIDLQGYEYEWELKVKTHYGAVVERKTDTFPIVKRVGNIM